VHGCTILDEVDMLHKDQIIHGQKPISFAQYFGLMLCTAQQVEQDGYDNGQQYQLKHVVNDYELIHFPRRLLSSQ